jgi:biopolymer transport protein TolR
MGRKGNAMTAKNGSTNGPAAEINVTPMVDVLLVLLIIFMVIVPALPRGEAAVIPRLPHNGGSPGEGIVLEMNKDAEDAISFRLNQQQVAKGDLQLRLAAIFANRAKRVFFLKGDERLSFTRIAEIIDLCHSAGINQIGLIAPRSGVGK